MTFSRFISHYSLSLSNYRINTWAVLTYLFSLFSTTSFTASFPFTLWVRHMLGLWIPKWYIFHLSMPLILLFSWSRMSFIIYYLVKNLSSPRMEQTSFYEDFLAYPIFMYSYLILCMLVTSPAALTMACMSYFICISIFAFYWKDFKGRDCNLHIQHIHVFSLPSTALNA